MLGGLALSLMMLAGGAWSLDGYLQRAIERGVPLFNGGNAEACAAVYATALEGVVANQGWEVDATQRDNLADRLDLAAAVIDPVERAWAYRQLIDQVLSGESIEEPQLAGRKSLFDFSRAEELERWRVIVDGVMGGQSTGAVSIRNERLVFSGTTSLENNGGFSSIRARVPSATLAGYDSLRIRVRGDGRTYIIGASDGSGGGDSYWTRFSTSAGEWKIVTVPIEEMERQYFGNPIQGRIRPSAVRGLEFYIYDKQAGPFQLEVDSIEAVRDEVS